MAFLGHWSIIHWLWRVGTELRASGFSGCSSLGARWLLVLLQILLLVPHVCTQSSPRARAGLVPACTAASAASALAGEGENPFWGCFLPVLPGLPFLRGCGEQGLRVPLGWDVEEAGTGTATVGRAGLPAGMGHGRRKPSALAWLSPPFLPSLPPACSKFLPGLRAAPAHVPGAGQRGGFGGLIIFPPSILP